MKYIHEFFDKQGFVEDSPPMFISSAVEGGATLFNVKCFDDTMYLTQSAQLHLEVLIYSLEKFTARRLHSEQKKAGQLDI